VKVAITKLNNLFSVNLDVAVPKTKYMFVTISSKTEVPYNIKNSFFDIVVIYQKIVTVPQKYFKKILMKGSRDEYRLF
jgi:hypothetical protein